MKGRGNVSVNEGAVLIGRIYHAKYDVYARFKYYI